MRPARRWWSKADRSVRKQRAFIELALPAAFRSCYLKLESSLISGVLIDR